MYLHARQVRVTAEGVALVEFVVVDRFYIALFSALEQTLMYLVFTRIAR